MTVLMRERPRTIPVSASSPATLPGKIAITPVTSDWDAGYVYTDAAGRVFGYVMDSERTGRVFARFLRRYSHLSIDLFAATKPLLFDSLWQDFRRSRKAAARLGRAAR